MNISDLLWFFLGEGYDLDGQIMTKTKHGEVKQHIDLLKEFFDEQQFPLPKSFSVEGFALELAKRNIALLLNAGKIDGKYAGFLYLPERLSRKQIESFEGLKSAFEKEFYHHPSFFGVSIYRIDTNIPYKVYFTKLKEAEEQKGRIVQDGIELFYQEIERQKEILAKTK